MCARTELNKVAVLRSASQDFDETTSFSNFLGKIKGDYIKANNGRLFLKFQHSFESASLKKPTDKKKTTLYILEKCVE
jgi:hypothetical protein